MFRFILRQLWRATIFILGFTALVYIVQWLWPNDQDKITIFFSLLITYCLMAYIVIPALFRLYHFFIEHDHIPLYATYGDGWASDPVNIAVIVRDKSHLQSTMKKAGWYEADPITLMSSLKIIWSTIFNTPYPTAPISNLYLFNRRHDITFQIPNNKSMSARTRHHVRFWRLEPPQENRHDRGHFDFWNGKLKKWLHIEREIWIGACTEDFRPLDIRWRTGGITHGTRHDADKERDFIISSLEKIQAVSKIDTTEAGEHFKFRGQSFRTIYTTDGSLKVVKLKSGRAK